MSWVTFLHFQTDCELEKGEEPVLGFEKMPALHFLPPHENKVTLSLPDVHQGANDSNENSSEESSKQCQKR